jgi:hypothetical protein
VASSDCRRNRSRSGYRIAVSGAATAGHSGGADSWQGDKIGIAGHIYRRSLFALTLDPDNPNFASSLRDGNLRRHVVHEVHHCLRKGGPGYGNSLGEALVSEGLAGQFVTRLFGTPPEPWERAVESPVALSFFPAADVMASTTYDHRAWFFGAGGQFPRWLGYTLGYMIVGRWIATVPEVDGVALVNVAAADVLSAWSSEYATAASGYTDCCGT